FNAQVGGQGGLWWRDLRTGETAALDGTRDAFCPVLSPDGEWVAYSVEGELRTRRLRGGPANVVGANRAGAGGCWDTDGFIYAGSFWGKGIARVSERGGDQTFITSPEKGAEQVHYYPCPLPGGGYLAMVSLVQGRRNPTRIDAVRPADGERRT